MKSSSLQALLAIVFLLGGQPGLSDESPVASSTPPASPSSLLRTIDPIFDPNPGEDPPRPNFQIRGGIEEQNLKIEWNDWHNKVADAIMGGVFENFIQAYLTPEGASAWYRFDATSDRHIKNAEIVKTSGYPFFDSMIIRAINKLDGNWILSFPEGSKRTEVTSGAAIVKEPRKVTQVEFGDTEVRELDPQEVSPAAGNKSPRRKKR